MARDLPPAFFQKHFQKDTHIASGHLAIGLAFIITRNDYSPSEAFSLRQTQLHYAGMLQLF